MFRNLCLLLCWLGVPIVAESQNVLKGLEITTTITYAEKDTTYNFKVIKEEIHHPKAYTYYWFSQGVVHHTEGGYTGKLVHGTFEKFNRAQALLEKGEFSHGLKTGQWLSWYASGKLKSSHHWKDSQRRGGFTELYENGSVKRTGNYSHDKLTGTVRNFAPDGKLLNKEKYRKGVLVVHTKKEKVIEAKDTTTRKKKKIVKKKEKKKSEAIVQPEKSKDAVSAPEKEPTKRRKKKKEGQPVQP